MEKQEKERLGQIISLWEFTDFRALTTTSMQNAPRLLQRALQSRPKTWPVTGRNRSKKSLVIKTASFWTFLNNISDMGYQELRDSIRKSLSTARKLVERSAKAQQQSKAITEKFSENKPSVQWGRRNDGSAWISVGDPAGFPHYACDYYGDLNTGPRSVADFSEPVPEWVVIALDLNHILKGKN